MRWSHYHIYIYIYDHYYEQTVPCSTCLLGADDQMYLLYLYVEHGSVASAAACSLQTGRALMSAKPKFHHACAAIGRLRARNGQRNRFIAYACISIAMPMAALASRQPLSCCGLKQAVRHARTIILSRLCSADSQPVISNTTVVFVS